MKTAICIFEDEGTANFLPLTYTRPVYDLLCGMFTLRNKILNRFPGHKIILHTRKYLADIIREQNPDIVVNHTDSNNVIFINGRLLINSISYKAIKKLEVNSYLRSEDGSIIAANISGDGLKNLFESGSDYLLLSEVKNMTVVHSGIKLVKYPWELVNINGEEIRGDYESSVKNTSRSATKKYPKVEFKQRKKIFISGGASIDPFVFLDATDGPIYIGRNVRIMSHTFIQGPVFIGNDTIVKKGAAIYHGTSIGEVCRIGGEVETSIIHSFANKQHEGFLGHSYLGSWVNLGADTNNSDLKNNYENITVLVNGRPVDTGSRFVGLIMGDHSKTAINTMFNTGTIVGVSCNIFGAGFPPRFIPSFSWGGSDFLKSYDIKKSLEVAFIVHKRRNKDLSPTGEKLLREIFVLTAGERSRKMK